MSKQITIQSMCDTKTENVSATVRQIKALEKEGCDLVRVAVPTLKAAEAIKKIKRQIKIPLIADIHFDPELALAAIKNGADKIRINPGNIADPAALKKIIKAAKAKKIPIRIGVNSGSLEKSLIKKYKGPTPRALAESATNWIKFFESQKFTNLFVSIKSSDPETTVKANELLFASMKKRKKLYPIHLGVTEAGTLIAGITKTAIALSQLLKKGIGDTIRISLTADPVLEVKAAKELLKALNLYTKEPIIISCPTCGRTEIDLKKLVAEVEKGLVKFELSTNKTRTLPLKIAIMGCVVNGPGEAREADYALCGGRHSAALYKKGKFVKSVPEKEAVKEFLSLIKRG
jgi:(E)-4-hydroxy-3-methylbut-2-enyl-diphosphate synthase